jgi:hypothetical protein
LVRAEGRGREGAEGWRLRLTRSAEALAIMCPTLFLIGEQAKVDDADEDDQVDDLA